MSVSDYTPGQTGSDPSEWSEKKVAKLPQRGTRPALDLAPDGATGEFDSRLTDAGNFYTKSWSDPIGAKYCQEDYDDLGHNDLNQPVPMRKYPLRDDGYDLEPNEALGGGDSGRVGPRTSETK